MFPRNLPAVLRPSARRMALLLSVCVLIATLSCDVFEGSPDASAPKGFDDPDELMQACAEKEQEIFQWGDERGEALFENLLSGEKDLWELEDDAERLQEKVDTAMQKLSINCRAEVEKLRTAARRVEGPGQSARHEDNVRLTTATAEAARVRQVAAAPALPPAPRRPTSPPVPELRLTLAPASTPAPTPVPTTGPVLSGIPLAADFLDVPPSHNGEDALQFLLRFTEPVSTSYKVLRDVAIQAVNGTVLESKRVDKRNDLWMVTVEPDRADVMVITLTAPADCDDPASVCTEGGKALSNSPVARVPYGN